MSAQSDLTARAMAELTKLQEAEPLSSFSLLGRLTVIDPEAVLKAIESERQSRETDYHHKYRPTRQGVCDICGRSSRVEAHR